MDVNILQNIVKDTPKRYWTVLFSDNTVIGEIPTPIYNYSYKKTNFSFKVLLEYNIGKQYQITIQKSSEYNVKNVGLHMWVNKLIPITIIHNEIVEYDYKFDYIHWKKFITLVKDMEKNAICLFCRNTENISMVNPDLDLKICNNEVCNHIYSYIYLGNDFLEKYWNERLTTMKFYLYLLTKSLSSNRIDTIYVRPNFFHTEGLTKEIVETMAKCKVENIERILLEYMNADSSGIVLGDAKLFKDYPYLYMMIRYNINLLSKYYVIMSSIKDQIPNKGIDSVFEVKYEAEPEGFDDQKNDYLFHGSGSENWISILSNGLQTGTKENKLFLNGAVYGAGIYLSDSANYSYNYMTSRNVNSEFLIMGVFQVAKEKSVYKKAHQIYVVNNGDELKLRYLVVFRCGSYNLDMINKLSTLFGSGVIKEDIAKRKATTGKIGASRLMKEFKKLYQIGEEDKMQDVLGVKFRCQLADESSLNVWNIDFLLENVPENTKLYKQLKDKNIEKIRMEFRFSSQYPIDPPFCRVIYPRFKFMKMNITRGGSFCNDMLTKQHWSPIYTVDKVLLQIKTLMLEDEGELDLVNWDKEYTLYEAQEAYKRMIKSHNW